MMDRWDSEWWMKVYSVGGSRRCESAWRSHHIKTERKSEFVESTSTSSRILGVTVQWSSSDYRYWRRDGGVSGPLPKGFWPATKSSSLKLVTFRYSATWPDTAHGALGITEPCRNHRRLYSAVNDLTSTLPQYQTAKIFIFRSSCFEDAETERGCVPIVFRLWGQRSKVSRSKPKATKRETCLCLFRRIYLARTITCLFCSAEYRPRRWPPLLNELYGPKTTILRLPSFRQNKSQRRWLALLILPGSASLLLLKGHQRIRYACYVFLSRYEYAGAFITAVIVVPTFLVILPNTNNLSEIAPMLEIWLKTRAWRHIIAGKDILLQPLTA